MGVLEQELTVKGVVREVNGGIAIVDSEAGQGGRVLIRNAEAEVAAR
jgi:hypothetical protein